MTFPDIQADNRLIAVKICDTNQRLNLRDETWSVESIIDMIQNPREVHTKNECSAVSPGQYTGAVRKDTCVSMSAFIMDIDDANDIQLTDLWHDLGELGCAYFAWTTCSHIPEKPKWRVMIPLAADVPAEEWGKFWGKLHRFLGSLSDTKVRDLARIHYLPSVPQDRPEYAYERRYHIGNYFDPAEIDRLGEEVLGKLSKSSVQQLARKVKNKGFATTAQLLNKLAQGATPIVDGRTHAPYDDIVHATKWIALEFPLVTEEEFREFIAPSMAKARENPAEEYFDHKYVDAWLGQVAKVQDQAEVKGLVIAEDGRGYEESPTAVWLPQAMKKYGVTWDRKKQRPRMTRGRTTKGKLVNFFFTRANEVGRSDTQAAISSVLGEWQEAQELAAYNDIRSTIAHVPGTCDQHLDTFLGLVCKEVSPLTHAVVKHWLRNVKRGLLGLPIDDHMLIFFSGDTGIGKSRAFRELCRPLSYLMGITEIKTLMDTRSAPMLEDKAVVFVDEVREIPREDFTMLKTLLSGDSIAHRYMREDGTRSLFLKAAVAMASNHRLDTVLKDQTSARRFYEILCRDEDFDWDAINALPYEALWQSIDPEGRAPLDGHREELKAHQEELRYKSPLEEWAAEELVKDPEGYCTRKGLHEASEEWLKGAGYRFGNTRRSFCQQLRDLGYAEHKRDGYWGFRVAYVGSSTAGMAPSSRN